MSENESARGRRPSERELDRLGKSAAGIFCEKRSE